MFGQNSKFKTDTQGDLADGRRRSLGRKFRPRSGHLSRRTGHRLATPTCRLRDDGLLGDHAQLDSVDHQDTRIRARLDSNQYAAIVCIDL